MLEPHTGPNTYRRFLTYDLEWVPPDTRPAPLTPSLVGVYDGSKKGGVYRAYDGPYAMRNFLASELTYSNRGAIFYAHAGGLADIQFVLEEIVESGNGEWEVSAAMAGSSAIIVDLKRNNHIWTFCDSYWLLRTSLRKIGEAIGDEKGGKDYRCPNFPHCGHDEGKCIFWAPMSILKAYNESDCRILWKAIEAFQREILDLGGELKKTIAATGMHLFRSRFLRQTIHTNRGLNETWRAGYTASRVEVYRPYGKGRCYDINSSFPTSMREPAPGNMIGVGRKRPKNNLCMALAEVEVPETYLPPLPYRYDGKVYFPTGRWSGMFTGIDLDYLEECGGRIHKIDTVWKFEAFTALRDYVDVIYDLRKNEKGDFKKLVYKYLLNSLYGKFSEREEKQRLIINPEFTDGLTVISPGIFLATENKAIRHTHVPIAAHITALSRRLISRLMSNAIDAGSDIQYCDTDSIFTGATLPTSNELGALKLEYTYDKGSFAAPKFYMIEGRDPLKNGSSVEVKAKGFPTLTATEFECMTREVREGVDFCDRTPKTVTRMCRLRELYRKGGITPLEIDIDKRISLSERPKRCWTGDDSRPWTVEEITENSGQ